MNTQQKTPRGPVEISAMHSSGKSVANHEGKNFYFNDGIPGEKVDFVSGKRKQGFRTGEITNFIYQSPYRVAPFCGHHNTCNGCNWQHISYGYQLALKRRILCNALEKYGISTPEIPQVIPSPGLQYYRHRTEYTFSANGNALGFHNGEAGYVTDINECFLQQEPSRSICSFIKSFSLAHSMEFYNHEDKTGWLRSLSIRLSSAGDVLLVIGFTEDRRLEREKLMAALRDNFPAIKSLNWTVHLSPAHSQMQGEVIPYHGMQPFMYEKTGILNFRIHASSFFQPNVMQAANIFSTISEWADLSGKEKVVDLYTGVGTIAINLAPNAGTVIGIEGSAKAIDDAVENAAINNINNTMFMAGDILETFRPGFLEKYGNPDLVVLDPPRSGTLIEIKKTINLSGASRVIYLSCNPVSLAFDLKQLTEIYKVKRIQPFDMLPHTHHLETLVMLELNQHI